MSVVPVYRLDDLPMDDRGPVQLRGLRSENALVTFVSIEPSAGSHREPHRHPFDQLVVLLEGEFILEVNGIDHHLKAREAVVVPKDAPHRGYAVGNRKAELIEIFSPVRKDYIHLAQHQKESFADSSGTSWFNPGEQ
jgi:quercetin dioxygenase-like cupin family protein